LKPPCVLIVDDDEQVASLLGFAFEGLGLGYVICSDGRSAVLQFTEDPPKAVVLDLHLPRSTGFEVLAEMQRVRPDIPVVMLSASGRLVQSQALSLGATACLAKPFDPFQVAEMVVRLLGDDLGVGVPA
jgi:CheY-like chemotaxis protein